ncbi:MAG TPA: class II aldolase [Desulfobulbus sp.]|nr:class II aldolase [Desulfobulbus sp.]
MSGFFRQRRTLLDTALAMNRLGLNQGMAGNVSVRTGDGFLITPSAMAYEKCAPVDMVRVAMDGRPQGRHRPSSEWRLHRDIYLGHPEAGAVLHAHPPWCTVLACLEREIPAFHYMVAVAGGDSIPLAGYATFGSAELSALVGQALAHRSACLMAHHGMVCFAAGPEEVLALALEVENLARAYGRALQVGEVPLLTGEQMAEVTARFAAYRQPGSLPEQNNGA